MSKFIRFGLWFMAVAVSSEIIWQYCTYKKRKDKSSSIFTATVVDVARFPIQPETQLGSNEECPRLRALNTRKPPDLWNTVLFFPDLHYGEPGSTTLQLYSYFENAKMSIQMCTYLQSDYVLREILQRKKRAGLIVQVITDHDTIEHHNTNCRVFRLRREIPVRTQNTGHSMHNKFTIIDEEAVLTGSLNITKLGICNNAENVVVTTDPRMVARYREEYAKIWVESKEVNAGRF